MTSSKWILGFAGEPRLNGEGEWCDTFIGGQYVFPESLNAPVPPCPLCGASRMLVLQAFAPHIAHSERVIYLFGCNSIKCSLDEQSWFAMRLCKEVQTLGTSDERAQYTEDNGNRGELETTEHDNRNEINWDTDSDSDASTASDLVADLAALSLKVRHAKEEGLPISPNKKSSKNTTSMKEDDFARDSSVTHDASKMRSEHRSKASRSDDSQVLESYYVEVGEEPERTKPVVDYDEVGRLLSKYEKEEKSRATNGRSETWETEKEEPDSVASENFEAFQSRISRAPEQILRYRFDSEPIWPKYPPPSTESKPKCECGSSLVFEVQVLGSCLHYLHPDKCVEPHQKEAGMNFAAVAIYTCRADCTSSEILAHSPSFKVFRQTVMIQQDEW